MSERGKAAPGRPARGVSAALGLGLTFFLWITMVSLTALFAFGTEKIYGWVGQDGQVLEGQRKVIQEEVEALAKEYGFSAENVMSRIEEADLRAMNLATGQRYSNAVWTGTLGSAARFNTERVEEALWEDESLRGQSKYPMTDSLVRLLSEEIGSIVEEKIGVFRELLVTAGVRLGNRVIRLPALVELMKQIPITGGLCALLAGGIMALLLGKRPAYWLWYAGASFSAGGALLALTQILIPMLGLGRMLGTISALLAREYRLFAMFTAGAALVLAAVMIVLGLVGMGWARKKTAMG